jgi:serine phosphatase RsbU (regulator of sigma subunit)/Tfp pilus assembly protein PilF
MKPIIYISLFLISFSGVSQIFSTEQQYQIDSLNTVINNPKSHDTSLVGSYLTLSEILYISNIDTLKYLCEKVKIIAETSLLKNNSDIVNKRLQIFLAAALNNIGVVYSSKGQLDEALGYFVRSWKVTEETEDKEGIALCLNSIGSIYDKQGRPEEALDYYNRSLKIREEIGGKEGMASVLNNIGFLYNNQGKVKEALDYHSRSLKIREEINDKQGIAGSRVNIGAIYDNQGQLEEALAEYELSLKIYEETGNKNGVAICLNNTAGIYKIQGQLIEALDNYKSSLKIYEEIGYKYGIAVSLINIGAIYNDQGRLTEAMDYYKHSLKIYEEIGYKSGITTCLNSIGNLLNKQGEVKEALIYGLESLAISKEIGSPVNIRKASNLLSKVYEKEGKGIKALEMYKLFITMRDSLENKETQKAATLQQAKYAYEKQKTLDDAAHSKILAIEQEEKEQQQILTGAIAIGLGLVVIFLIFVFNSLKATRKQKAVIEQQKVEVEQQKEVVELAHDELEEKNQEIMDSIIYAKRIQSAILPPIKVVKEYLKESFILYKPKDVVAGDFYWMEQKNGKVLFAAADCTGHGVPGAMVSVVCNNALNRSVREHGLTVPGEILDKTREIVVKEFRKSEEDVKDGMDIALCSIEGMKLQYAGAYNPLWIIRNGEIIETKANKQPIGQFEKPEPYTTHSFDLEKGDAIYIFSDGYVDQFGGERGKKFKAKAFRELLLSIQGKIMEEQKITINKTFENWIGELEQIDDVCVIGVRV